MKRIALALLLWCALIGVARAQTDVPAAPAASGTADEAQKTKARERFFTGLELAGRDDWEGALAEFEHSIELYPTRVALKNAAISLQQLRRFSDAQAMYQRLLHDFGAELPADEKKNAERAVQDLEKRISSLAVSSTPAGAKIVIDGKDRGTTPVTLRIDAGSHFLRLFSEGYGAYEAQLELAGGESKSVQATLERLTRSGTLRVVESSGLPLEVVVDGVPMGTTPWQGAVEVGTRSVILRGSGQMGTSPSTATIFENKLSVLTLKAERLDSELRVAPQPSNAIVYVDGVSVGAGVWSGRLPSGEHTIEAAADGFLSAKKSARLAKSGKLELALDLERDPSDPRWRANVWRAHPFIEAMGGAFWSPSFQGDAARACSRGECSDHSRPIGFMVGARGGYQLQGGLAVELFLGLISAKESMTRKQTLTAEADFGTAASSAYHDSTRIFAPAAALSASYRFLEKTPVTARAWLGVARARAEFENGGSYAGTASQPTTGDTAPYAISDLSISEDSQQIWLPFVGPELRVGYRVSPRLSFDVGAAVLLFFGPDHPRTGGRLGNGDSRSDFVGSAKGTFPDGTPVGAPGTVELPRERSFGTFFAVVPTLGARLEL
jgi:PEGA domain